MTSTQFAAYVRLLTKTNSTTLPDATIIAFANIVKDDLAKDILKVNEDIFGMQYLRNLVADQREYSLPVEMLNQIKYVEAMLDGVNWSKLTETDLNSYGQPTSEAAIRQNFADKTCFDIFRNSLWLLTGNAIINVTEGLKLWAIQWPEDISSVSGTSDLSIASSEIETAMPRATHEIWGRRVSIAYKESKEKPIPLSERELRVDADWAAVLNSLRGANLDRAVLATTPSDDGSDY